MKIDLAPCAALAGRYKLALAVNLRRGPAGDVLSRGVGSSVEFQDFRPYVPGDDPRYIDWSALARTDQLILRLHRADVQLALEVLLDASRSLAVGAGAKAERAAQVAGLLALLARKAGARVTLWTLGDEAEPIREAVEERLAGSSFGGRTTLPDLFARTPPRLAAGSIRVLVSDFLFPHDPARLQGFVAQGSSGAALLQVLSADEEEPSELGHARLRDAETSEERQMAVFGDAVRQYRERLGKLKDGLAASCRAAHVPYAVLRAERPLADLCRGPLLESGILEPA
jgi:uncharacterized protein (DUF58 family)